MNNLKNMWDYNKKLKPMTSRTGKREWDLKKQ